ncbi:unnamed protein product [Ophioblennius macclurei]
MTSKQVCLAALCAVVVLAAFIDSTQSASCCLNYIHRRLPCKRLLGYSIQTINQLCDIEAVVFHVRGKYLCADPASKATQRAKRCIDEREAKLAQRQFQEKIKVASKPA